VPRAKQVQVLPEEAARPPEGEANAGEVRHDFLMKGPIEEVVANRQRLGGVPVPSAEELTNREHTLRA
jgi:hypothetical protein